jgi:LuxR family transcriptional regulator, maltose regulon positive regulatory protein
MAGTAEVITTKLFRPSLRQHAVDRKRLHDLLRLGCTLPTLVPRRPAGGKSTLVAQWLAHDGITAGWVSLTAATTIPYASGGTCCLPPGRRRLDATGSDVLRDVLRAFVNGLASADAPLALVLDDYRLVTSAQVHDSVATHCPFNLALSHRLARMSPGSFPRSRGPAPVRAPGRARRTDETDRGSYRPGRSAR